MYQKKQCDYCDNYIHIGFSMCGKAFCSNRCGRDYRKFITNEPLYRFDNLRRKIHDEKNRIEKQFNKTKPTSHILDDLIAWEGTYGPLSRLYIEIDKVAGYLQRMYNRGIYFSYANSNRKSRSTYKKR